ITAIGGRKVSLHALRHTHASSLIAAGVAILAVSRRLGHANPTITLGVYGHLFGDTHDRGGQALDAMLSRARPGESKNRASIARNSVGISVGEVREDLLSH